MDNWIFNDTIKELLNKAFKSKKFNNRNALTTDNLYLNELYECIKNNLWYEYFKKVLKNNILLGENWIDFESEMANNIKELETYCNKELSKQKTSVFLKMLFQYLITDRKILTSPAIINNVTQVLYTDLNRLTRALEIYLSVFVSKIEINKSIVDLQDESFDYVLSFNYTNTYERIFKEKITEKTEICYLHGKAKKDATKNCNLVLGIDEYLPEDEKNTQLTFLPFKKFYQRIYKCTDNSYSKWIDHIHKRNPSGDPVDKFELHIFGHSLDVTDKDILRKFILNQNVQTKIYYHRKDEDDKSDFSSKIKNLIKIMGQDELIRRTGGGSKNTIEFIPQEIGI